MACCDSIIQYRFNIDWPLVPEPAKAPADYWLTYSRRLLCAFLARGLKMASKEIQYVNDSNGKGENNQRTLTLLNEAVDIHACLLVIQLRLQLLVASVLIESNSLFAETCFFYFLLSWRHYNWSDSPSGRWTCESMFPWFKTFLGPIWGSTWSKSLKGLTGNNFTGRCALTVRRKKTRHFL